MNGIKREQNKNLTDTIKLIQFIRSKNAWSFIDSKLEFSDIYFDSIFLSKNCARWIERCLPMVCGDFTSGTEQCTVTSHFRLKAYTVLATATVTVFVSLCVCMWVVNVYSGICAYVDVDVLYVCVMKGDKRALYLKK